MSNQFENQFLESQSFYGKLVRNLTPKERFLLLNDTLFVLTLNEPDPDFESLIRLKALRYTIITEILGLDTSLSTQELVDTIESSIYSTSKMKSDFIRNKKEFLKPMLN